VHQLIAPSARSLAHPLINDRSTLVERTVLPSLRLPPLEVSSRAGE
jgi:hypothetical protein